MSINADGSFKPGLKTTQWLASVGITNIRAVAKLGVIETCVLLRRAGHPVSLNLAYGLQADLMGTTWDRLPEAVREDLRVAYRRACNTVGEPGRQAGDAPARTRR